MGGAELHFQITQFLQALAELTLVLVASGLMFGLMLGTQFQTLVAGKQLQRQRLQLVECIADKLRKFVVRAAQITERALHRCWTRRRFGQFDRHRLSVVR